jgi:hypothetical protein
MLWRSSPYSPTLSYPVVLLLSSTARAVVFPDLGVVCFTNRTDSRPGSRREQFFLVLGIEILLFFLVLKTGKVQVGVNPVPSGAVGKDCQRRLFSRPRFVRAVAPRIIIIIITVLLSLLLLLLSLLSSFLVTGFLLSLVLLLLSQW